MYKIAITGKANVGKNTFSRMLTKQFREQFKGKNFKSISSTYLAFADPIKEMIMIMFPMISKKSLYGASDLRKEIIPGAFKDSQPLTIRQLLIDLGTQVGRGYKESIWLDNFDARLNKITSPVVIVTDVRFRNEFDHLKKQGFYMIRLIKNNGNATINHPSETNQESILDNEFDCVIDNNGSIKDLKIKVAEVVKQLSAK